jgi:hypothetical protein
MIREWFLFRDEVSEGVRNTWRCQMPWNTLIAAGRRESRRQGELKVL